MILQKTDSGLYECQISSTPVMSHILALAVTEPVTEILGGPDIYVEEGATMNLSCVVSQPITVQCGDHVTVNSQ